MARQSATKADLDRVASLVRRLPATAVNGTGWAEGRLNGLLELGCELLRLEIGVVGKLETDRIRLVAVSTPPHVALEVGQEIPLADTFCARAVEVGEPVAIPNTAKPPFADHPFRAAYGVQSYLGAPLRTSRGVYGTVCFYGLAPRARGFSATDLDMLRTMATWLGIELARQQAEWEVDAVKHELEQTRGQIERIATQDVLTGVLNRRAILERLSDERNRSTREQRPVGVFVMDLDRFRRINDAVGYRAADLLLVDVVNRVKSCLRSYDEFGRLAGKQFLAVLPGCDLASAAEIAERARVAISERLFSHPGGDIEITASFGVCSTSAADLTDDQLLGTADKALFLAKQRGKNSVRGAPPTIEVVESMA